MKDEPFGQIISITGMEIVIEIKDKILERGLLQESLDDESNLIKLYVGTVGDVFLIGSPSTSGTIHYGIFEEIKLVSTIEDEDELKTGQPPEFKKENKKKAIIVAKVIGYQDEKIKIQLAFKRGIGRYPRFNSQCYLLTPEEKQQLFSLSEGEGIDIGKISGTEDEKVSININKFLGKHSVILGATGSGKSCTVASLLQQILKAHPYSHIIFFDLHDEYSNAFPAKVDDTQTYSVNKMNANNFNIPYWFLNWEEFLSIFLGDEDASNSKDGIRILKEEILRLKEKEHAKVKKEIGSIEKISINSPLFFSFDELLTVLERVNRSTVWASDDTPAINKDTQEFLAYGPKKIRREDTNTEDKVNQDKRYFGQLTKIIEKLDSIKSDRRYQFLFNEKSNFSTVLYEYMTTLLSAPKKTDNIIKQTQLTIIDLSKIPSETIPIIIGMMARISFEYKLWEEEPSLMPLYLVFEEAHNYIPKESSSITRLPTKYIGRIAKEGRKYGISQLIVSQRPSDLSELIVSQCSNFFVLRVTNPNDQAFVNKILPDHLSAISNMIPFFQNGEALVAGECVPIPTKVIVNPPNPEPNSRDINFSNAWRTLFDNYSVEETINRWWDVSTYEEND